MSEIKTLTEDDLANCMMVSAVINSNEFIGNDTSRQYKDSTMGFSLGKRIGAWSEENKIAIVAFRFFRKGNNYQLDVWFEDEIDAMAFRLTWT